MRILLYQWRFVDSILKKRKFSTIRQSARCAPGDELEHRVAIAGRDVDRCPLIATTVCTYVYPVLLQEDRIQVGQDLACNPDQIAHQEGFRNWPDLLQWFHEYKSVPFRGFMIEWR